MNTELPRAIQIGNPAPGHSRGRVMQLAALALVAAALAIWGWTSRMPRRFAEVVPGRLYRCGSVNGAQLERLAKRYQIRAVLSLLDPAAPESQRERAAAEALHLRWINVPLRGNGDSTAEERARIKAALADESAAPLLVHCAAGTNRTGLTVGLYRLNQQGWTADQVFEEMKQFDFRDDDAHLGMRTAILDEAKMVQRP